MKGIFHPDNWNDWDTPLPNVLEIRKLDPEEDKYYLEYIVQHAYGSRQKMLMKKLGFSELPERRVNPRDPEDDQYEEYFVLREQVSREPDAEILKEAAYEAPTQMARFAFCRLTKYSYPAPWYYAYSYCTYDCGPEEKVYRGHLKKAEDAYWRTVKETAVESGFKNEERPIVFYHSFDPKDAEVICGLIEERFRARGGKRKIEFRWQEDTRLEDIELNLILPNGAGDGEIILRSKKAHEDRRPEMGDICCCGLPTMLELYYNTGNIRAVSPFIDTDNVFPEFLKQGTIKGEVCGVPFLVFKGNAGGSARDSAGGSAGAGTAEAAGDPPGWTSDIMLNWAGTPFGTEVSAVHSWAVLEAAGLKTYFTFLNNNNYGLKWLDCLDLQMLMTDSNFINDVCMACNAGGESPHVFPADSTVYERI